MFGIGFSELIILIIVLAILLGPDQLPALMRGVARFSQQISKARREIETAIEDDESLKEIRDSARKVRKTIDDHTHPIRTAIEKEISELKDEEKTDARK